MDNKNEEKKKAIRKSNSIGCGVLIIMVGLILFRVCSSDKTVEKPKINYKITSPEAYGGGGHFGNKLAINIPKNTSDEDIRNIVEYEAQENKTNRVYIGNQSFVPNEMIFFIYIGMAKIPGEEACDKRFIWDKKGVRKD